MNIKQGAFAVLQTYRLTFTNDNSGVINNDGTLQNIGGGTINNYGTINNEEGGRIYNDFNCGESCINTINNYGIINNKGSFENHGSFVLFCGSQFNNSGSFTGNDPIVHSCDTQAPQVTFKVEDGKGKQLSDGGSTTSKTVEIKFTVTDNVGVTSVECSLDGPGTKFDKQFSPCTSPVELSKLVKGTYTFTVIAQDAAGNSEPQTFTWTVK